ncbi:MAG: SprT family zinc-dependent metalloprotease [Polaromonas sp.]|nr:SprT family zinc-dependent metalloprotease [Polaromonas sp.]
MAAPRAAHEILLDGQRVTYALRRSPRRSIGFSVSAQGLAVSAPSGLALADIEQALQRKAGWIVRKLQETGARHQRLEAGRIDWRDGAVLPFRGEPLTLVLVPSLAPSLLSSPSRTGAVLQRDELSGAARLQMALAPGSAAPEQIQKAVQAWLMQQARQIFTERLNHFAPQLGVQWRQLGLSNATTRWGSAKADGTIRLNWRLLHVRPELLDYVVVHELSHLRVMDHSARFWAVVQTILPEHVALRCQLRQDAIPRW